MTSHTMVNGLRIPLKGKAIFKLDTGDFEYFDGEVTSLEYDPGTFTQL